MPPKTIFDDLFIFSEEQLSELICNAIDAYTDLVDEQQMVESDAQDLAVMQVINQLKIEKELVETEPGYIVTGQVIPTVTEVHQ